MKKDSNASRADKGLIITYRIGEKSYLYPREFGEWFCAEPAENNLFALLEKSGTALPQTVEELRGCMEQAVSSDESGLFCAECLMKNAAGQRRWYRVSFLRYAGEDRVSILVYDIHRHVLMRELAENTDGADALTGFVRRNAFCAAAGKILQADPAGKNAGEYAFLYLDILHFKAINEAFGMEEGDKLLVYVAEQIAALQGDDAVAGRTGADRFALLVHKKGGELKELIDKLLGDVSAYELAYEVSCNIGVYVTTAETLTPEIMLDRAVIALSSVKGSYAVKYAFFDETQRSAILSEQEIVGVMNTALSEGQFVVYYQPQYDHAAGSMVGAEALVRWQHPERGLIPPGVFIPIFEKNGFINEVDSYVFEHVCEFIRRRLDEQKPLVPISVNLTRYDLYAENFLQEIERIRARYGTPSSYIRLEITESAVMGDEQFVSGIIEKLHSFGYVVEMDDFGSGYSSLNVLKDFDLDILKLDMKFLSEKSGSNRGGTILSSIVRMAKWLGLPVIAEGVEKTEQADFLQSIGCSYIQGFLYARPMPEAAFCELLEHSRIGETKPQLQLINTMDAGKFWNPESQETLIFSNYVGGACIFDYHEGHIEILRLNQKYLQELGGGFTGKDAFGSDLLNTFDAPNRAVFLEMLEKAVATGEEQECETWRHLATNCCEDVCIRSTVRMIGDSGNGTYLFYEMIRNITGEKDALAEIMHREMLFRAASEQVNIYYWEYIVDTKEMFPCFRCMRDLGLPARVENYPEPAIEMGIFPPEVADQYRDMMRRVDAGETDLVADIPLTAARIPFRVRYTTEYDENGRPVKAYGSAAII